MNREGMRNIPRGERIAPAVRVVLDTRVLRSAVWGGRASTTLVDAWLEGRLLFCVTEPIMSDYFAALMRLSVTPLIDTVLEHLRSGESVRAFVVGRRQLGLEGLPEDELVTCARQADAAAVVTHDPVLLDLGQIGSIGMMTPGAFVRKFLSAVPQAQSHALGLQT